MGHDGVNGWALEYLGQVMHAWVRMGKGGRRSHDGALGRGASVGTMNKMGQRGVRKEEEMSRVGERRFIVDNKAARR